MTELPEEAIEAAEEATSDHDHRGVDDTNLLEHLRSAHGLATPGELNPATMQGIHDRLHGEDAASDR